MSLNGFHFVRLRGKREHLEVKRPSAFRRLLPRKREHRRNVETYSNFDFNTESRKGDKIVTDKVSGSISKRNGSSSIISESLVKSKNPSTDNPLDMSGFKTEKKIVNVSSETSLFLSAAVEYEVAFVLQPARIRPMIVRPQSLTV